MMCGVTSDERLSLVIVTVTAVTSDCQFMSEAVLKFERRQRQQHIPTVLTKKSYPSIYSVHLISRGCSQFSCPTPRSD